MKRYTRKSFLHKAAIMGLGGGLLTQGCIGPPPSYEKSRPDDILSPSKLRWKMVTTWPPGFPVLGEGAELFAQWVAEMSGGRLEIRVYGAGELIPAFEAFDAVSSGTADMASGAAYYWAGKVPAAQFFASVPFGMNAQQLNSWIYTGGGQQLWEEAYAPYGLIPMLAGNTGVQMGGWFNKAIEHISDFKGLKMRMPGLGAKVLEKAGASPVSMPGGEIYTNLETGVIDATEWIGPYHDHKMGFSKIARYYYAPGWHEVGSALELFVNKARFQALPSDLQSIMQAAAYRLNMWTLAEFESQNARFLEIIKRESPAEIRQFPKEVLDQLRLYTREVIADLTARDAMSQKVYASYTAFQHRMKAWAELTERSYYNRIQG